MRHTHFVYVMPWIIIMAWNQKWFLKCYCDETASPPQLLIFNEYQSFKIGSSSSLIYEISLVVYIWLASTYLFMCLCILMGEQ